MSLNNKYIRAGSGSKRAFAPISLRGIASLGVIAALGLAAVPAFATVKDGVDAWSRGDYAAAVSQWEGPANAGDPDAMFNLAQAYRLGRGVGLDSARAEGLYASAASSGHVQAADTYGLMMFQDGRYDAALPYVQDAANRGDPRSQYLLGIAHFNGDIVAQDWVRAYALLTLANGRGLPQAAPALAQMDQHIPLDQRQQAAGLAVQMQNDAQSFRARELASADLNLGTPQARQSPAAAPTRQIASATPRIPRPIQTTAVSPSVAAARAAVAQAAEATGTADPSQAGAGFANAGSRSSRPIAAPTVAAPRPAPTRTAAATTNGPWRVQLGAFGVQSNANKLWNKLSSRGVLAGKQKLLIPAGRVTKLQAGGFSTRASADQACRSLKSSGQDCLVTRR